MSLDDSPNTGLENPSDEGREIYGKVARFIEQLVKTMTDDMQVNNLVLDVFENTFPLTQRERYSLEEIDQYIDNICGLLGELPLSFNSAKIIFAEILDSYKNLKDSFVLKNEYTFLTQDIYQIIFRVFDIINEYSEIGFTLNTQIEIADALSRIEIGDNGLMFHEYYSLIIDIIKVIKYQIESTPDQNERRANWNNYEELCVLESHLKSGIIKKIQSAYLHCPNIHHLQN